MRIKVKNNKHKVLKVILGYDNHVFKIGDYVKHNIDNTIGKISSISDYTTILWNDGYKERIITSNLKKVVSYVDYVEEIVQPMNTQQNFKSDANTFTKQVYNIEKNNDEIENNIKVNDGLDDIYLSALQEDNFDDIEDGGPVDNKKEITSNINEEEIKKKAIDEVINVMKNKGILKDEAMEESQRQIISLMDDNTFENFKNTILNKQKKVNKVEKTEAELMLEKIKANGPIIGDFSAAGGSHKDVDDGSETRSLFGKAPKQLDPSMNDTMENIINNLKSNNMAVDNDNIIVEKEPEKKLNFDGFKNIQGIKKPIQIQNNQQTPRSNLYEAISNIDWTIFTRQ